MVKDGYYIRIAFDYSSSGLWRMRFHIQLNKFIDHMIDAQKLNLPEDIANRLANWSRWVDIEMTRQKAYSYNADVDADNFNRIGREIATAIKTFLGDEYLVEYVPIEKTGRVRHDQPEIIT